MESVVVLSIEGEGDEACYRVRSIATVEDVEEAVAEGRQIYSTNDMGAVDELLFDGERWTSDRRPDVIDEQVREVPSVPYVDQRFELLQAESEALADALLEIDPTNAVALAVKGRAEDVRVAMTFDSEADMDRIIGDLRRIPVAKPISEEA